MGWSHVERDVKGGYLRRHEAKLAFIHRLSDALIILASLAVAMRLTGAGGSDRYAFMGACGVALFQMFAQSNDLYRSWRIARIRHELGQLAWVWGLTVLALMAVDTLYPAVGHYEPRVAYLWYGLVLVALGGSRIGLRVVSRTLREQGFNTRQVAILGCNDLGRRVAGRIRSAAWMGLRLEGFFDDRCRSGRAQGEDLHGDSEALLERARRGEVDMVFITLPLRAEARVAELVSRLSDTTATVYVVPDFLVFELLHGCWGFLGDIPVVSVHDSPFNGVSGWVKRAEDIVLASFALALFALPMVVITLAIRWDSPGPVFFRQRRYGLDGREIRVWKFRTMTVCEDGDRVPQARRDDPRVTRVGRWLRRTSLDELPQLFNVLKGEMSLVGPRPHAVAHNEQYRRLVRGYMLRYKVPPGMTGWAQVNGWRGETDTLDKMAKRVEHDLYYIQNWSLWLDLKILALTLVRGFKNAGAY